MKSLKEEVVKLDSRSRKPRVWGEEKRREVFIMVMSGKPGHQVSKESGVSVEQIVKWKREVWWRDWVDRYCEDRQADIFGRMNYESEKIYKGYMGVMEGVDPNDKTANAKVQGMRLYLEAGKSPVVNKRAQMTVNNNTLNIGLDMKKIGELTADELLEINLTGRIPEKVRVQEVGGE